MASKYKNSCPNCGDGVDAVRWGSGYKYCRSSRCFEALGRRSEVPLYEKLPTPDEVDLDPYELDDVADQYAD